jgi:hypothetical protein
MLNHPVPMAAGLTVWRSKLGGGEIFRIRPYRPWVHPASDKMDTGFLSWG